jgi:PAS domain-containing protein
MRLMKEHPWYSEGNEQRLIFLCFAAIALIASANAVLLLDIGLAFLYLIPLTIAAAFFSRWQLLVISLICTLFAEGLSHEPIDAARIPRAIVIFASYVFVGLVVRSLVVNRRAATRRLGEIEQELSRQHDAEVQSQLFLNSAPIGILAVASDGKILTCNRAAHEILGVGMGGLVGKSIDTFLPAIADVSRSQLQQFVGLGKTIDCEQSQVHVWASHVAGDDRVITVVVVVPSKHFESPPQLRNF